MPLRKYIERIAQYDQLVRMNRTGPPSTVAKRLGLSKRAFHDFKTELIEDFGFPIAYCSTRQTYYYTNPGKAEFLAFRKFEDSE